MQIKIEQKYKLTFSQNICKSRQEIIIQFFKIFITYDQ